MRRARIFDYLTKSLEGSRGKAQLLAELSADPAYPPEERAVFARVSDAVQRNLDLYNSLPTTGGMLSPDMPNSPAKAGEVPPRSLPPKK